MKKNWIVSYFCIATLLITGISITPQSNAWCSEKDYSAHYYMINKAVDYLREKNLLDDWPLETYVPYLIYGDYWADYPNDPIGVQCEWSSFKQTTCESLHHFATGDCIKLMDIALPHCIAKGYFGAPEYATTLYDLAVKFWPKGEPVPSIYDLPYYNPGGFFSTVFDWKYLGPFVIGAHPFVYEITGDAYRWPGFVDEDIYSEQQNAEEDWKTSLYYLGWAIHLIQDLTCPVHAAMETGTYHADYEAFADGMIAIDTYGRPLDGSGKGEILGEMPVNPGGEYLYTDEAKFTIQYYFNKPDLVTIGLMKYYGDDVDDYDFSVRPDFFHEEWVINDFAQESIRLSKQDEIYKIIEDIQLSNERDKPFWGVDDCIKWQVVRDLDTGIKMTAGIIYKFFSEFELEKDRFDLEEPYNNNRETATELQPGIYEDLTVHSPRDEDYYILTVPENFSKVRIICNYSTGHDCEGGFGSGISPWKQYCELIPDEEEVGAWACPEAFMAINCTETGWIYEEKYVPEGRKYLLHFVTSPYDRPSAEYSLFVHVGKGDYPPDQYERNDEISMAKEFSGTFCDFTGEVCLHNNMDKDYYKLFAKNYSVKAEISFNPNVGDLELYLDGKRATQSTYSDNGTKKTLTITGCGKSPSYVLVQGSQNFYEFCINKIPLEDICQSEKYKNWSPLNGNGTFTYIPPICEPDQPIEEYNAKVREIMYAKKISETANTVIWNIACWLDQEGDYYPVLLEYYCPKTLDSAPIIVNATIFNLYNVEQAIYEGRANGLIYGSENLEEITGFSAEIEMIHTCHCCEFGNGTLKIHGGNDSTVNNYDFNGDNKVNVLDIILIRKHWGKTGEPGWIPEDVNKDGVIDILDIILICQNWGG